MARRVWAAALASCMILAAGFALRAATPTIHASMTQVIAPHAQTIWDVTNRAANDRGDGLDASKISQEDWTRLGEAGRQIRDRARLLSMARTMAVADPGVTIGGEGDAGAATARQVQAYIDANRAGFAEHANALAQVGETVAKASETKNVAPLYAVASGLDEVCEGCHARFWYPQQAPPR